MQISSFSIYIADVLKHVDESSINNGGLPIFLFGHSMVSTTQLPAMRQVLETINLALCGDN